MTCSRRRRYSPDRADFLPELFYFSLSLYFFFHLSSGEKKISPSSDRNLSQPKSFLSGRRAERRVYTIIYGTTFLAAAAVPWNAGDGDGSERERCRPRPFLSRGCAYHARILTHAHARPSWAQRRQWTFIYAAHQLVRARIREGEEVSPR